MVAENKLLGENSARIISQMLAGARILAPKEPYLVARGGKLPPAEAKPLGFLLLKDGAQPVEKGSTVLWTRDQRLQVLAVLLDSDIGNSATEHNDRTWATGDVFELFFKPRPDKPDYFELHLTPEEITLQLHVPSQEELTQHPLEDMFCQTGFKVRTELFQSGQGSGWLALMDIPFAGILVEESLAGASFAVCRYNYNKAWPDPEISSTTRFPKGGGFHQPAFYHKII